MYRYDGTWSLFFFLRKKIRQDGLYQAYPAFAFRCLYEAYNALLRGLILGQRCTRNVPFNVVSPRLRSEARFLRRVFCHIVKQLDRVRFGLLYDVDICVVGDCNGGVTEKLAHILYLNPFFKEPCCECMAQRME